MRHTRSRTVSVSVLGLAIACLGLDQLGLIPSGASAEQESTRSVVQTAPDTPASAEQAMSRVGSPRVELANRLKSVRQSQPGYDPIFISESQDPFARAASAAPAAMPEASDHERASGWTPRLSTVIATGQVRSAIIDGVTCTQGQEIAGVGRIIEIRRDSVVIEKDGEVREIFVRTSGT